MQVLQIFIYIVAIFLLIIGLMLSGTGSTGGLAALSGQDLELFKKTKDYGFIKVLKILMFLLILLLLILCLFLARSFRQ